MTGEKYLKRLGEKIAALRKKKRMSQNELARRLDTGNNAIRRIERGKVNSSINMLRKIAKELRVSLAKLVDL